jgi:hypothetical protein
MLRSVFRVQRNFESHVNPPAARLIHLEEISMPTTKSNPVVSEEKIREIAHQLWMEAGKPEGQAESHWYKALALASAKAVKKSAAKKPAAKTAAKPSPAKKPAAKAAAKPATKKPAAKK